MRLAAAALVAAVVSGPAGAFELPDFGTPDPVLGFGARPTHAEGIPGQAWIGGSVGGATGTVKTECSSGPQDNRNCEESGFFHTYGANFTLAGRSAFRFRWTQSEERHTSPKPYELAAMVGGRMGRSNWYGLVGGAKVLHPDNNHPNEARALAYEILFAPASEGVGFELSFAGGYGNDVQYFGFNLGLRFGMLK